MVVRYADDLVAMCVSRDQAEEVKTRLAAWLAPRGLAFNDKTRILHFDEGFDFLGFQRPLLPDQAADQTIQGGRAAAPRTARWRAARPAWGERCGGDQTTEPDHPGMVGLLPDGGVQRGVAKLDKYVWTITYKWAAYSHSNKSKRWVVHRYFGTFNRFRRDRWVLVTVIAAPTCSKFAWTKIVRHQMVPGTASPDDPNLATY